MSQEHHLTWNLPAVSGTGAYLAAVEPPHPRAFRVCEWQAVRNPSLIPTPLVCRNFSVCVGPSSELDWSILG